MNNCKGITLIELMVVLSIMGMMLVMALPNVQGLMGNDSSDEVFRSIIRNVKQLKLVSVRDQINYTMHIDTENNLLWVSNNDLSEEELLSSKKSGYSLPEDLWLSGVSFPGDDEITDLSYEINFYAKGYSDKAIIHLKDSEEKEYSFVIEPFLSKISFYEKNVSFNE